MSEKINYPGPEFLHKKLSPIDWKDIDQSARRSKKRESKKLRNIVAERHGEEWKDALKQPDSSVQIQNYLDRFHDLVEEKDPQKKWTGKDVLKRYLHIVAVIKHKDVPESYFDSIRKRHRQEGHGDIEIPEEIRKNEINTLIDDQKNSLDGWVDYLVSDDAKYPDWLKYYTFRNIIQMGRYNKSEKKFTKREGKGTASPFPELNREALAIVLNDLEKQANNESIEFGYDIDEQTKQKYLQLLKKKKFPELYAFSVERFKPISKELLKNTNGKWIKYSRGSNPSNIVESLSKYGTGWCLRGEATAKRYLEKNNLYVFYSNDKNDQAKVPRVVIVEDIEGKINEVRGIKKEENLDSEIGDVVENKLKEFGTEGEKYKKRSADMKKVTQIEEKTKIKQELTKEELTFLYEIDNTIEGFGYEKDPRIQEIRDQRNIEQDMSIIFDFTEEQIAHDLQEINENTKAYVGQWNINVFNIIKNYPNIKHIYEQFPDKKIFLREFETNPTINSPQAAEKALKQNNIYFTGWAKDILKKTIFNKEPQHYNLVGFTVEQLGFPNGATTEKIYNKAKQLGLKLCSAEVGPQLRLQYQGKQWIYIAMEPIVDRDGNRGVFDLGLGWDGDRLELSVVGNAKPTFECVSDVEFVFSYAN